MKTTLVVLVPISSLVYYAIHKNHDLHFIAPDKMREDRAVTIIDKAIRKIKKRHPKDFMVSDLEKELSPKGFTIPRFAQSHETL